MTSPLTRPISRAYPSLPPPRSRGLIPKFLQLPPHVRHYFRPSVRLKTTLYMLSVVVLVFLIMALKAGSDLSQPRPKPAEGLEVDSMFTANLTGLEDGESLDPAIGLDEDLNLALTPSQIREEILRSFAEPDYALLNSRPPREIECDVPLYGEGAAEIEGEDEGVLLLLGIFSGADRRKRRDIYRRIIIPEYPSHLVSIKFILAAPPKEPLILPKPRTRTRKVNITELMPTQASSALASPSPSIPPRSREEIMVDLEEEMREHDDIVMLPISDNIDLGKTYAYFKWVAKEYGGEGRVSGRPRFVMKADDDTILVMPNIMSTFTNLDCNKNVYWGTSAGRSRYFGEYFRGLAYGLSWPLVSWIGNADMPPSHVTKIEDARTGQWLRHLDPVLDPVQRIDMGWTMGDWNQLDMGIETIALHWAKLDQWVTEQHDRILSTWAGAGREYNAENGVPSKDSIIKGRTVPHRAQEEHQRQKDLGWDVHGQLMRGGYDQLQPAY